MKVFKKLIGMVLFIGFINPIIFTNYQQWYQGLAGILASFLGCGLIYGFNGYSTHPRLIGNENVMPIINQVWIMFLIGCICNLLWATLYV